MTESGGLPEVQHESTVWLFRGSALTVTEVNILLISCYPQHWPSPMSWSALTLLEVRCDLLKQSCLTFFKVNRELDGIRRNVPTKSGVMKDPADVKHESTVWLFRDAFTFSDVLIGIDFVRGKMWASQTVTLDLLQKSVGNPWRNRAVFQKSSLKAPCGFLEVHPWPSQRSTFCLSAVILNTDLHRCPDRHWPC